MTTENDEQNTVDAQPRLRAIEVFSVTLEGEPLLVLRDPEALTSEPLILSAVWGPFLMWMDGTHTLHDMQRDFAAQVEGVMVPEERIEALVNVLNEALLLDNPSSRARLSEVTRVFNDASVRPAQHAGSAYPEKADELLEALDNLYEEVTTPASDCTPAGDVMGILVPHVDPRVGGAVYAQGYTSLLEAPPADLYVILGVAHCGGPEYFVASNKDFETPLGRVTTCREVLGRWEEESGGSLRLGEVAHRMEHSIEFQLPFLQHGLSHEFEILPVLCGGLEPLLAVGRRPEQVPEVARKLEGLAVALGSCNRRVQFVVSVDLSHVGPKFGDSDVIQDADAERVRKHDLALLQHACDVDPDGLFEALRIDQNARRVDATVALHTFLKLLGRGRGEVVAYDQNRQPDTGSMVSFASMVFRGE